MKWYRNHWFYIGAVLFIFQAFILICYGSNLDFYLKMMILSFMALNAHQFEEYAFPGGFPVVWNMAFSGETAAPDRYPLNKKSAFVCNVGFMYPVYLLAIIFSNQLWLGLTIVLIGAAQFFVHGIALNKKLGTLYNPGMASIIFLFIPLFAIYIWHAITSGDLLWWHWIVALLLQPVLGMGCLMMPMQKLKDKNSPYRWTTKEMAKFNVAEKLAKKESK